MGPVCKRVGPGWLAEAHLARGLGGRGAGAGRAGRQRMAAYCVRWWRVPPPRFGRHDPRFYIARRGRLRRGQLPPFKKSSTDWRWAFDA